jgi:hemerythrin-like domain-containing protein
MSELWEAMDVMKTAHVEGQGKLDDLARSVVDLKEGRRTRALEGFEAASRFFYGGLRRHFDHEERALFPVLARIIGRGGPIDAMEGEHETLWRCIDEFFELAEALDSAPLADDSQRVSDIARLADHIIWTLRGHIQREDTMLFPLAERTLSAGEREEVTENLRMVEQLASQRS